MVQASNKMNAFSHLAITLVRKPKQRILQLSQSSDNSSYISQVSAHHQAVVHIREVQAEYLIRGWIR